MKPTVFILTLACAGVAHAEDWPSPEAHRLADEASAMHQQALEANDHAKYDQAHRLYQQYLARYPDRADASLSFFDAELLNELERFDEAADLYERVVDLAPKGKYLHDAAYAYVMATRNAIHADDRDQPDAGAACPQEGPCALPPEMQRLITAFDKYIAVGAAGNDPVIPYRRARLYYEYHQYAKAAPLFDAIVAQHPSHELAGYAVNLELDCWSMVNRLDQVRSAIDRFKKSPVLKDDKLRRQVEQLETALKNKP